MIFTCKAPISARIERDEKDQLETTRWACIVMDADGILNVKFDKMSWAEAVVYRNMFEAIQKAALICKQEFTLTFGEVKPEFNGSATTDDVKTKLP